MSHPLFRSKDPKWFLNSRCCARAFRQPYKSPLRLRLHSRLTLQYKSRELRSLFQPFLPSIREFTHITGLDLGTTVKVYEAMDFYKWLIVIGAVLLVAGLATAFLSSRYTERVMGEARKGIAVLAPEPDSPALKERERLVWWSDFWLYIGLAVTVLGVFLQTLGSILPLSAH